MNPKISIAFRFHGNFYHSYRGDTPDELGFGKDIRIIRHIIKVLDELNQNGVPVKGTWDFENYFSLEKIMPEHCPDIIEDLKRRAKENGDEMQLMSYNNGLVSGQTTREFESTIKRGICNQQGSGLRDLFGDSFFNMVRPQEMLFTPLHLKLYKNCGIDSISLFYSALPFNGFSNFIPQLSPLERYNPLTLTYPGIEESMILMPCYNTGDLADHLSLRRWVKQMRRQQMALSEPRDMLLLIDMDADDEFWIGFDVPLLKGRFSTIDGLKGLVDCIKELDYVEFTTPGCYLKNHAPVGEISFGQDCADGSFDGVSSWAEKWSNHYLWTGLERARILELQTRQLCGKEMPEEIESLLAESFEARIKLLSTTHFGMASPVMNLTRTGIARDLTHTAVQKALQAFRMAAETPGAGRFSLTDYPRGDQSELLQYPARYSNSLLRLPLSQESPQRFVLKDQQGEIIPHSLLQNGNGRELIFKDSFNPEEKKNYTLEAIEVQDRSSVKTKLNMQALKNEFFEIGFNQDGQIDKILFQGKTISRGSFLESGLSYEGKTIPVRYWYEDEHIENEVINLKRMHGGLVLPGSYPVHYRREIMLAAGMPYLYVRVWVEYPHTPHKKFDEEKAKRLQTTWDDRWQEVRPCQINPSLLGKPDSPLRVWKHNYFDHLSTYSLDYSAFSKNVELDSVNNHITHGWAAVSDGQQGLLVAQSADINSGMAFCPMRTWREGDSENSRVALNPFGSYTGKQYHYDVKDTGLGGILAVTFSASDHIKPYAPSYNGRSQTFSLLIAPYDGDKPPQSIRSDAEAFTYPYLLLNDEKTIAEPSYRAWDETELDKNRQPVE